MQVNFLLEMFNFLIICVQREGLLCKIAKKIKKRLLRKSGHSALLYDDSIYIQYVHKFVDL